MNEKYDAAIIGAGIIGAAIAFEMAKMGYKTLNIDKLPAAGYGPTGNSCAVIRTHYSTWDGTAMAYESLHYWRDWANYIEAKDERGFIYYINKGCIIIKSRHYDVDKGLRYHKELGIEYEQWDPAELQEKIPFFPRTLFGRLDGRKTGGFGKNLKRRSREPFSFLPPDMSTTLSLPHTICNGPLRPREEGLCSTGRSWRFENPMGEWSV